MLELDDLMLPRYKKPAEQLLLDFQIKRPMRTSEHFKHMTHSKYSITELFRSKNTAQNDHVSPASNSLP